MDNYKTAYFVYRPTFLEDLIRPHLLDAERPYEIAARIRLGRMDYENFVTDMRADRQFIEDHYGLCAQQPVLKCLLVQRRGAADGVLVVPERERFVKYAAYTAAV